MEDKASDKITSVCCPLAILHIRYTSSETLNNMSHVIRKPDFCLCENKDADLLRSNRETDQCLCFRYQIVQSLYFQSYKPLVIFCSSPVCVRPGRKSRRPVFSQRGSYNICTFFTLCPGCLDKGCEINIHVTTIHS